MQFVVIIVFMIGFLVLMLTHEDIKHVYTLEDVVKKTLTKPYGQHSLNFKEVKDVVEIWKWLDYGLLPAIVRHKDPVCCDLQYPPTPPLAHAETSFVDGAVFLFIEG